MNPATVLRDGAATEVHVAAAPTTILCLPALAFLAVGSAWSAADPLALVAGFRAILTSPSLLLTDYLAVGGVGAAFMNAGLLGILATVAVRWLGTGRPGYEIAGVYLVTGFGLFGKNLGNVWPHVIGVWLFSRLTGRPLRDLFPPLVFGTTLAPIVSQYAFGAGLGWPGVALGLALGVLAGFLLAALMGHMQQLHEGYTLYNIGTAGGFVGIVVAMIMRGFGVENAPVLLWTTGHTRDLAMLMGTFFAALALLGVAHGGTLAGWRAILTRSGRLPCDFTVVGGLGAALWNMAALGFCGLAYVLAVGGPVNGPIIAGLCGMAGFGALGKHPRNALPIMAGVFVICLPKIWSPADPGPLLAALFCTSLAPFCGRFGPVAGFVAGALHLPMVMHIAAIHGFLNLYNNGFAGGLTMTILIGTLKGLAPHWLEGDDRDAAASPTVRR